MLSAQSRTEQRGVHVQRALPKLWALCARVTPCVQQRKACLLKFQVVLPSSWMGTISPHVSGAMRISPGPVKVDSDRSEPVMSFLKLPPHHQRSYSTERKRQFNRPDFQLSPNLDRCVHSNHASGLCLKLHIGWQPYGQQTVAVPVRDAELSTVIAHVCINVPRTAATLLGRHVLWWVSGARHSRVRRVCCCAWISLLRGTWEIRLVVGVGERWVEGHSVIYTCG